MDEPGESGWERLMTASDTAPVWSASVATRWVVKGRGTAEDAEGRAEMASQCVVEVMSRISRESGAALSLRRVMPVRTEIPAEAGVRWTLRS